MKNFLWINFIVLLLACQENDKPKKPIDWNDVKSIELNKELSEEQDLDIRLYIAKYQKKYKIYDSGSGLRMFTRVQGNGISPIPGQKVDLEYVIKLLDGKEVYKTDVDFYDVIKIDNAHVESGLQEGLKKMKEGEEATLVFPSHLGHGLVGDMAKIPPLSPLVLEVKLVQIQK
jgi:FKBP-type peptidyl-prolyl cis-trans isomerase